MKRNSPKEDLTAHIIFTEDSFDEKYPLLSRTYSFTSDNKAFWPSMGGYSIFASCLDGTDPRVRLEWYMAEEGNPGGWKVEDCYILEQMQDATAIPRFSRATRGDGATNYFFGETCIRVKEVSEDGKLCLEPVAGERIIHGEWVELPIDQVYGYCTLLTRHLNKKWVRIKDAGELVLVARKQDVELSMEEADMLLGYLEGHDYCLMADSKGITVRHDEQYGDNHRGNEPYTVRDTIEFCQKMNDDLLRSPDEADEGYLQQLRADEQVLASLMELIWKDCSS